DGVLGGAASYFSMAAALYAPVRLVGVVGDDFKEGDIVRLRDRGVDLGGLERRRGTSFRWKGTYDFALDTAETINTDLGVFGDWRPSVPKKFVDSELVFLANIDPEIQLATLAQVKAPRLVALDTMNYWIEHKRDALVDVMAKVDVVSINEAEARQLCETYSVVRAAREILDMGPSSLIVKRGEHGAALFTREFSFWAPAYPVENIADPTGAGDTFAGGFLGALAESETIYGAALKRAMLHGVVCSSFSVESFSIDGMAAADRAAIERRYEELRALITL